MTSRLRFKETKDLIYPRKKEANERFLKITPRQFSSHAFEGLLIRSVSERWLYLNIENLFSHQFSRILLFYDTFISFKNDDSEKDLVSLILEGALPAIVKYFLTTKKRLQIFFP